MQPAATNSSGTGAAAGEPDEGSAKPKRHKSRSRGFAEWGILLTLGLVVAIVVRLFLFQAFYIPSGSMEPTLQVGDRVLVNEFTYRLHDPQRGDIIVFDAPAGLSDPSIKHLVKRIIGVPGDTVTALNGKIYINGVPLHEPYLSPNTITNCSGFKTQCFLTGPIPAGFYWVMGDNRSQSEDSRFFGVIPRSAIVGKVFVRTWPLNRLNLW